MSQFSDFESTRDGTRFMVHRLNLPATPPPENFEEAKALTGSKSGIAVLDEAGSTVIVPPSSSAEVDFWVFGNKEDGTPQVVLTHHNPQLAKIELLPTLEQFAAAWNTKRATEEGLNVPHGFVLANVKTHGGEESLIRRFKELGIPTEEVVLLDQEPPATDRIMRETEKGRVAPLALRVSRIESMESVLMGLRQQNTFAPPFAIFYDPVGQEDASVPWPFEPKMVSEMYNLAPHIEFVLCCPSRWGKSDQIGPVADRLRASGLRRPVVMTDIPLIPTWELELRKWEQPAARAANG